jgi:hypothetical protein
MKNSLLKSFAVVGMVTVAGIVLAAEPKLGEK